MRIFKDRKGLLEFLKLYLAINVVATVCMLIYTFPNYPQTAEGWLKLLVIALPALLAMEFVGWLIWHNPLAQSVESRTEDRSLSWLRITYGLIIGLLIAGLITLFPFKL